MVYWLDIGRHQVAGPECGSFCVLQRNFHRSLSQWVQTKNVCKYVFEQFLQRFQNSRKIKSDRATYLCGRNSELLKYVKQKEIYLTYDKLERKKQIAPIDVDIREVRKHIHNKMKSTSTPMRLWNYI